MKTAKRIAGISLILPLACLALFLGSCASLDEGGGGSDSGNNAAAGWRIHYQRPDGDYSSWDLWVWPTQPNAEGAAYRFGSPDGEGWVTARINVADYVTEIGFIIRAGGDNWLDKDIADDRFTDAKEIWLKSGDPRVYTAKP
ncbi:MAG: hypothetical protein LBK63_10775 [Treponema sp.]|jgi:hypothetical protein|nr:hypothetical protein [Treponema sp.]